MRFIFSTAIICTFIAVVAQSAVCDVQVFSDNEKWQNNTDGFTFIGFTEYPQGTILTDQYADLGVTFPEANAAVLESDFLFEDGHGIFRDTPSGFDNIWVEFDEPVTAIAVDFLGLIQFELFTDDKSIHLSNPYSDNGGGFAGLISEQSFDKARIFDPGGVTAIDNLYFGPPIPAPGVLGGFAIAALCFHRRRRR